MSRAGRLAAGLIALLGWAAIGTQLTRAIIFGEASGRPLVDIVLRFFSFFTILTNLGVAALLTIAAAGAGLGGGARRTFAAAASYILVVGLIYELFLRRLTNPQGIGFVADMVLHDIVPLATVAVWFVFVRDGGLRLIDPLRWLIYPLAYFLVIMASGALGAHYPYYFLDAGRFGYPRVLANAGLLLAVFLFFGFAILLLDRGRRLTPAAAD